MERRDLFYKSVFTIKFDYEEREQKGIECYRSGVLGLSNAQDKSLIKVFQDDDDVNNTKILSQFKKDWNYFKNKSVFKI